MKLRSLEGVHPHQPHHWVPDVHKPYSVALRVWWLVALVALAILVFLVSLSCLSASLLLRCGPSGVKCLCLPCFAQLSFGFPASSSPAV